ncbi:MAG: beta-ketoacyl-ACP synthase 3 [Bacteroidales bacterium]|nr:beta-ketoacyl-ACP synthase 3 [Bacteroidales bacterium]
MQIIGTGSALPEKVVSNDMLAGFLDTSDEWITSRTGIATRRLLSNDNLGDLAIAAARQAVASSGVDCNDIDYIICSNVANNYVTPSLSTIIQGGIGDECSCPCMDLNGACAGFIYAIDIAEALLKTDRAKHILIVCAEEPSKFCNWHQRETSVLFGDGAGAVVVTGGDGLLARRVTAKSQKDVLYYKRPLETTPYDRSTENAEPLVMHGRDVFRMAVQGSLADINALLTESGLKPDDIDFYLLHQANMRIIKSIREGLGQEEQKFPCNLQRYGNTSSASIPILIDELTTEGRLKDGALLMLSAFGAGFVTGAALLRWGKAA